MNLPFPRNPQPVGREPQGGSGPQVNATVVTTPWFVAARKGATPQLDRASDFESAGRGFEPEWTRSTKWSFPRRTTVGELLRAEAPKASSESLGARELS